MPAPLGPTSATISPASSARSAESTATTALCRTVIPRARSTGAGSPCPAGPRVADARTPRRQSLWQGDSHRPCRGRDRSGPHARGATRAVNVLAGRRRAHHAVVDPQHRVGDRGQRRPPGARPRPRTCPPRARGRRAARRSARAHRCRGRRAARRPAAGSGAPRSRRRSRRASPRRPTAHASAGRAARSRPPAPPPRHACPDDHRRDAAELEREPDLIAHALGRERLARMLQHDAHALRECREGAPRRARVRRPAASRRSSRRRCACAGRRSPAAAWTSPTRSHPTPGSACRRRARARRGDGCRGPRPRPRGRRRRPTRRRRVAGRWAPMCGPGRRSAIGHPPRSPARADPSGPPARTRSRRRAPRRGRGSRRRARAPRTRAARAPLRRPRRARACVRAAGASIRGPPRSPRSRCANRTARAPSASEGSVAQAMARARAMPRSGPRRDARANTRLRSTTAFSRPEREDRTARSAGRWLRHPTARRP